jgi:hypothetical protein
VAIKEMLGNTLVKPVSKEERKKPLSDTIW